MTLLYARPCLSFWQQGAFKSGGRLSYLPWGEGAGDKMEELKEEEERDEEVERGEEGGEGWRS